MDNHIVRIYDFGFIITYEKVAFIKLDYEFVIFLIPLGN